MLGLGTLTTSLVADNGAAGAVRTGPFMGGLGGGRLGTKPVVFSFAMNGPVLISGVVFGTGGGALGFSKLVSVGGNLGLDGGLSIGLIGP